MTKALLAVALASLASLCSAKGPVDDSEPVVIPTFVPDPSGIVIDEAALGPIEKRMNAIIIPPVDFRQAAVRDIVSFLDNCIQHAGGAEEREASTRVTLVPQVGIGHQPLVTFAARNMPLLYALKLTCELGNCEYTIDGRVVTVRAKTPATKDGGVP